MFVIVYNHPFTDNYNTVIGPFNEMDGANIVANKLRDQIVRTWPTVLVDDMTDIPGCPHERYIQFNWKADKSDEDEVYIAVKELVTPDQLDTDGRIV